MINNGMRISKQNQPFQAWGSVSTHQQQLLLQQQTQHTKQPG
jgi:hypothetical protein